MRGERVFLSVLISVLSALLLLLFSISALQPTMYKSNKITSGIIYADALPNATSNSNNTNGYSHTIVTVNNFILTADLATTLVQQTKGLSIKDHLNENEGMLFVFKDSVLYPFWMKDMKFPIDIIWLDNRGTVIHIEHNLEPCIPGQICPSYGPTSNNAVYVLEVVAGFSQKHNVNVGTHVGLHLK